MFAKLFGGKTARRRRAHALYTQAIAQARQPALYKAHAIPDTLDGRFDLAILHVYLLVRVLLKDENGDGASIAREVQEAMFENLDQASREHGIGDLSVGKHVTRMATAFFGRHRVYDRALEEAGDEALVLALSHNVYRTDDPVEAATSLAGYVRSQAAHLEGQLQTMKEQGAVDFLPAATSS